MRHRHHPLAGREVTGETVDAVSIVFDIPAELEETYRYRSPVVKVVYE